MRKKYIQASLTLRKDGCRRTLCAVSAIKAPGATFQKVEFKEVEELAPEDGGWDDSWVE